MSTILVEHQNHSKKLQFSGLRPVSELASTRECGDRLRYLAGCRCDLCRKANTAYERDRQKARAEGDWNGIVSAEKARAHLLWLSGHGVGRRAVGAATDISDSILSNIRSGRKLQIRARTERKILAVTLSVASDHSLIPADTSWKLINELLSAGFTKSAIAKGLGLVRPVLQISRGQVTVRNAYLVEQLHARLINSDEACVDSAPTRKRIALLRDELIPARQIASEISMEFAIKGGELRLPNKIPRRLEKRVAAVYERWME